MGKTALILFTRIPVPGKIKTRMMPFLSGMECAALQKAMTLDTADTLAGLDEDLFVFYSDEGSPALLDGLPNRARLLPQCGVNLGQRMYNAIEEVWMRGYAGCLLLGSDLPRLTPQEIIEARQLLETNDVILCPSSDGGYWLVGMHTPFQPIFQNQRYGTDTVLGEAIARCKQFGLEVGLGSVLEDMDIPADLLNLQRAMEAEEIQAGPRVTAWLCGWKERT